MRRYCEGSEYEQCVQINSDFTDHNLTFPSSLHVVKLMLKFGSMFQSVSRLAACCCDAAVVQRLCVESLREDQTSFQPTGSLGCGHVLDDVLTERTSSLISQSEEVCCNGELVRM